MAASTIPIKISAVNEILKWSAGRPAWQRDALRRKVAQESIEPSDIDDLDRMCRSKRNAVPGEQDAPKPEPLTSSHLPPEPGQESSVVLVSLESLQHVNRLPSDQTLAFGVAPGLSIVYGDNGSGKSSYARVLKKACRFRGAPPVIKPNAYMSAPTAPATAKITCKVGGVEAVISWTDGQSTDSVLSNVFTFDGSCATHYLTDDGPASFTPHGLDILPKLSLLCDRVRERIQRDIATEQAAMQATLTNWKVTPTTAVGALISSLSEHTKSAEIDNLAVISVTEREKLREINETLKSNPKQKAKETRAVAARLRVCAATIEDSHNILSDEAMKKLHELIDEDVRAEAAAKLFSENQFDDSYLAGTGEHLWRAFWEAAKQYSTMPYPDVEFPSLAEDAQCLLCQRPLDDRSRARLARLRDFCKDESLSLAATAKAKISHVADAINNVNPLLPELAKVEADLDGITDGDQAIIRTYAEASDSRLVACRAAIVARKWAEQNSLPTAPHGILAARADALDERAVTEASADDPDARARLVAERDALADREWLVAAKQDVETHLARIKRIALLKVCQKDTTTNAVTAKNSELTKKVVTETFCQQFQEEVKGLGLNTISVELQEGRGQKGETKFGLRLKGTKGHAIHEVASEGEQRCIGLAAFLAELSQASHRSALVFDDPVSSLDHWYRERIAIRLAKESEVRQVIVFTHDTAFLNDLMEAASAIGCVPACCYLEWSSSQPGACCEGLPWDHMQPEERLKHLDECLAELRSQWSPQPTEQNRSEMKTAYSKLRNTLERVVEHVMLANVVFRFRRKINMNGLREVLDLTQSECDEVLRLYRRCHNLIDGHDTPSAQQVAPPAPNDLDADIAATKKVVEGIRNRRKAASKAAKSIATSQSTGRAASGTGGT